MLHGRQAPQAALDAVLQRACGALVVRGEAGAGKTALLEYAAANAPGLVLRAGGVESESEFPYAALHQLLRPILDHLGALPPRQSDALLGAIGLDGTGPGDRFLVGQATLGLLAAAAATRPLVCLVDDAQWLDRESADALLFAARRLHGEALAMLFGTHDDDTAFTARGLPELRLGRIDPDSARRLVTEREPDLPPVVRDQIVALAEGNPLALVELPRMLTPEQRIGAQIPLDFACAATTSASDPALGGFRDRVAVLPEATRTGLLVAALDGSGNAGVLTAALDSLGASLVDFAPAERAGLVRVSTAGVVFRHPLARTAALRACDIAARTAAHLALAAATGDDRRARHLAAVTPRPDAEVADELERLARRPGECGGLAAVAAAYARAAELTADPIEAARRWAAAAAAAFDAGLPERAADLVEHARLMAETAPRSARAEIAAVRARLEAEAGRPLNGVRLLHEGARAAEDKPTVLALLALAGHLTWSSTAHPDQTALARRTVQLHPGGGDAVAAINGDLLQRLEGDAVTAGSAPEEAAIMPVEVRLLAARHALVRADLDGMLDGAARLVDVFRSEGRQARLPDAMTALATAQLLLGKHRSARATAAQCAALDGRGRAPWSGNLSGVQAWLAAAAGQEAACEALASEAILDAERHSWMPGIGWAECGRALLDLAAGRHEAVLDRLERARQGPARHAFLWRYSWPDYIEAAVRAGSPQRAKPVLRQYEAWAHATGSARPLALLHRARALLAEPDEAGALYARALELHAQAEQPFEEARTRLAYGAWLRRRQHRGAARVHLQTAADLFIRLDAAPWAARAAAELRATGVSTPDRQGDGKHLAELTPQELQVVRLAAEGASNREIGAQLFLSPRTVGYHLYKAFPKLGVASRKELAGLSARNRAAHADITEKPWAVQRTTDRSTYPDPDDDSHPTEAAEAANPIASPP